MRDLKTQLEERFYKNINFLKKHFPPLFEKINEKGKIKAEIDILSHTQFNLKVNDFYVYPSHPEYFSRHQVERFLKAPRKFKVSPPGDLPEFDTIFHSFLRDLKSKALNYGADINGDYFFDGHRMHCLLIEGLLFGYHLESLIERLDIKVLVLLELDPELLKPSLYVLDWPRIVRYFSEPGRRLYIAVDGDPENLARKTIQIFTDEINFVYLTFCYNFSMFKSPFWEQFEEKFRYLVHPFFRGWGFYDDEVISLVHSLKNIDRKVPLFRVSNKEMSGGAACVVGSGPSLDYQLEWLKKHRESLVIFSCGTAIKTLEKAEIKPDFHVEIERTAETYLALQTVNKDFLRAIPLIAPSCVDPRIFELTAKPVMFPKANDVGGAILKRYGGFKELFFCNPTVTNTGLALATEMGFREIYLVGVDLGFVDPERHHSSGTVYYAKDSPFSKIKLNYEEFRREDGRIVYTTDIFLWTKKAMEFLIDYCRKQGKSLTVYNLSDTLPIEGTIPLPLDKAKPSGRRPGLDFKHYSWNRYAIYPLEVMDSILASASRNTRALKDIFPSSLEDPNDLFFLLDRFREVLLRWSKDYPISHIFFDGSVRHFQRHIVSYAFLMPRAKFSPFFREARETFFDFLDRALKNLEAIKNKVSIGQLADIEPTIKGRNIPIYYVLDP